MRLFKDIKRFKRKLERKPGFKAKFRYTKYYKKLSIIDNTVLLEATNGNGINGNIFYIAKELGKPEYSHLKIYLTVKEATKDEIQKTLDFYGMNHLHLVRIHSSEYCKVLASVKYLFTDATFVPYFIKKEGQIYTNVWHGTPLKHMGKDINSSPYTFGNILRNFLMADNLLYPNEFTKDIMLRVNNADGLYENNVIIGGYPRNAAFFNNNTKLKTDLELDNYRIYAYMPTWRGSSIHYSSQKFMASFILHLYELDEQLKDDQIVFLNLHIFMSKGINLSDFKHIRAFPTEIETYDFLNICDCLITDYSSVMFDYANTNKPVLLYTFDEADYLYDRGLYLDIKELPFFNVKTCEELTYTLNHLSGSDYKPFLQKYCPFDSNHAAQDLCSYVILHKNNKHSIITKSDKSKKENIIIYSGELLMNGITSSLFSMLSNFDRSKYNLFLTFQTSSVANEGKKLLELPDGVSYIPLAGSTNYTIFESIMNYLFYKLNVFPRLAHKVLDVIYIRELKRCYYNTVYKSAIHFSGYNRRTINLFERFHCEKIIFVHSNMVNEIKHRQNQHLLTLKSAYANYDHVAVVTEGLIKPTEQICSKIKDIQVVRNTQSYDRTQEMSKCDIQFNESTISNVTLAELKTLVTVNGEKFISIGRFSVEKDHAKLIRAFEMYWKEHNDSYLYIIGGHGKLFDETLDLVESSIANGHIILISTIQNPYAILKYCDLFILSSNYEGLPMVFFEADALGIPVVCTDIEGPKTFLEENHGYIVENSDKGIYDGMCVFHNVGIPPMNIDIKAYNEQSMGVLYKMIEK